MEFWQKTCLLLCCYGFFKELRPSEPFLTEYLLGPVHNLTEEQVYYEVYPVWTYSYMAVLVAVFLLTDLLRYKPVIVFEAVAYIATWLLLLWARGVPAMQTVEFFYGIVTATEVAYYTYIYAQVSGDHYQKVSSFTRAALLSGRFSAGALGQVLYSTGAMDAHTLNYVSLASVTVATVFAVCLPAVKHSIYFHRGARPDQAALVHEEVKAVIVRSDSQLKEDTKEETSPNNSITNGSVSSASAPSVTGSVKSDNGVAKANGLKASNGVAEEDHKKQYHQKKELKTVAVMEDIMDDSCPEGTSSVRLAPTEMEGDYTLTNFKKTAALMWADFLKAYSSRHLLRWSVWWAVATCGFLQILNYIQPLYESVLQDDEQVYNGGVDAASTLLSAGAALSVGFIKMDWSRTGEVVLAVVSLLDAFLLLWMGLTKSIAVVYACYVVFRVSYEFLITIAGYQVAKELTSDSYGLVFGLNMFLSLVLQTLLTLVVVDLLQTDPRVQFIIYACYFGALSLLFMVLAAYRLAREGCAGQQPVTTEGQRTADAAV